jgi:hypothetical protein
MPPGFEVPTVLVPVTVVVVPADTVVIFETVVELATVLKVVVVFGTEIELEALLELVDVEMVSTDAPVMVGIEECVVVVREEALRGPLEMTT